MQILKQMMAENGEYKNYTVPSNTKKGKTYTVSFLNGRWRCDCYAGKMGKQCKHIKYTKIWKK
jgi:hypothetical protein